MRRIVLLAVTLAAAGFAAPASAGSLGRPCTSAPESRWLTLETLKAKAEAQGYKVQKAKLKAACGEIYVLERNGARAELFVDPTSGEIVEKH